MLSFKKILLPGAACLTALAGVLSLGSCSSNDGPDAPSSKDIEYSSEIAKGWHNYTVRVAELLAKDSENLYKSWNESYNGGKAFKDTFREHNNSSYPSALSCIDEILAGCETIANEVGEQKIGSPYQQYKNGNHEGALYAVESWYSWHSRDDYSNNIVSIRNSYFGSLDNKVADNSIAGLTTELNPELDSKVKASIEKTYNAILSIPQPFRNNIVCAESEAAMAACDELKNIFANELRPFFSGLDASHDAKLDAIVANYVDNVVLPTYSLLKERNAQLLSAVKTLAASPSDTNFSKACDAWLSSREPWEESEAFLFGPVDALGLDPNMDSWPLDQDAIVNILKSGNFNDMLWNDDESKEEIEASQNIRGFHTLEFLLFKDGQPRKVK